ncbi:hypothetical protein [Sphingomonas sp. CROZ-RG-20F-R02-07]|uniref:hypothetical protein n=1 Tax=Sphingomonas sp. CROZ-RG-20F-R02-07 TaxID=2914832 RepID=UPI001F584DCD|nr:hypothetical protein [Sphingomonas sp. CROZ-RG-20F-R02-07]
MSRFAIRHRYAAPRPFVRHPAQFELFELVVPQTTVDSMRISPWRGLPAWHHELDRQSAIMRPRRSLYHRFEATARQLTADRIRACRDATAISRLVNRLSSARYPSGNLHDLDRVWSRAELGDLLVEATNRRTLLAMGRDQPHQKGPPLDPQRLPDDRLEHLIQSHRDLAVVETLRAERERRTRSRQ